MNVQPACDPARESPFDTKVTNDSSLTSFGNTKDHIRLPDGALIPVTASRTQLAFAEIVHRTSFEHFLGLVIIANLVVTVIETDLRADDEDVPAWMKMSDVGFVVFYALEIVLRLYIWRLAFFAERMHIFEFGLVLVDVVFQFVGTFPNIKVLRVIRLLRLTRTVRVLMHFRELYIMAYGMLAAVKALFWAAVMLGVWLTVWGIVTVELIQPLNAEIAASGFYGNCERCGRAYGSVPQAILTYIQQIVAGDSWGVVTVPIIERYPASSIVFFAVLITVNFGLLNLILAVIVDRAHQAREGDVEMRMREKAEEWSKAKRELTKICENMDEDRSGQLSLQELLSGYDGNDNFRAQINMMDVHKEDLNTLFAVFDRDGSGSVTYKEFIKELHKMKTEDSHMMLIVMRHRLSLMEESISAFIKEVRGQISPPKLSDFGGASFSSGIVALSGGTGIKQDKLSFADRAPAPPHLGLAKESIGEATVTAQASKWDNLEEAFTHLQQHLEDRLTIVSKELVGKFETYARGHDRRLDAILGSVASGSMKIEQVPSENSGNRNSQQQLSGRNPGRCMPNHCNGVFGIPS